ncbi:MAG: hypothetical protein U1F43_09040 [Myxococcota bacterium]
MAEPAEPEPIPYWPYYCEENAWRLLAATALVRGPAAAVLVANRGGRVACWSQRAADPGEPVLWDYHVVVAELEPPDLDEPRLWDPDCRLGPTLPASAWLAATFLEPEVVRPRFHPRFRVVPRERWVAGLATDRSHMRRADGRWRKPPPPWDPPGAPGMNLEAWLDQDADDWIDRATLEARWLSGRGQTESA